MRPCDVLHPAQTLTLHRIVLKKSVYFPHIQPGNEADGVFTTQTFDAFERLFTIVHGYAAQGIFKFSVSCSDNSPFILIAGVDVVPTGTICFYATSDPPVGWLLCNGDEYEVTRYSSLAGVMGASPPQDTVFQVPNIMEGAPPGFYAMIKT